MAWYLSIRRTAELVMTEQLTFEGVQQDLFVNFLSQLDISTLTHSPNYLDIPDQTPCDLDIEVEVNGIIAESAQVPIVWNPTVAMGMQQYVIGQTQLTAGFTAQDRAQLNLAVQQSSVDLTSTAVPTDLHVVPVGKLPGDVPLLWSERVGPFSLTGRGTLDLLGQGIRGIWTGLRWFYEVIPPQWGMKPGAIDEFQPRPAQLVPIFQLGSGEEIGNPILDTNTSGGFERLELFAFTGKIAYDVSPGWTVSLFMYRVIASG